jgi:hypothetical protein
MSYNQDYNIGNQSNDMHDVEMGIEENKKGKTKTPSTGTLFIPTFALFILTGFNVSV